jgi:hypothetical protein
MSACCSTVSPAGLGFWFYRVSRGLPDSLLDEISDFSTLTWPWRFNSLFLLDENLGNLTTVIWPLADGLNAVAMLKRGRHNTGVSFVVF